MQKWKFFTSLLFWFFTVGFESSAQELSMDGVTTIQVSYDDAVAELAVSAEIIHSFPANSYSEVRDTVSKTRTKIWLSCPSYIAQEGFVYLGDKKIHLFMIPSDTIFIKINGQGTNLTYKIEGGNEQVERYYQAKSKRFPTTIGQLIMNNWDMTSDLFLFKTQADSLYALDQAFWDGYEYKKLLPSWFVRYESDAIRYTNAWLRLRAISYRKQVRRVTEKVPENYFSFLETLAIRNVAALYDYEYLNFLREYISYKSDQSVSIEKSIANKNMSREKAVELLGKEIGEFYIIFSISEALNDNPKEVKTLLAKRSFSKTNNHLLEYLQKESSKRSSILSAGKSSPNFFLSDSQDSLISLSQFKGQVVYLSFWFAGCKGCIEEFPYENEMVKNFNGKPVKIISICTRTSREKWLKTIDNFGLQTLNLYANSAWEGRLEEKFGINVYPHYVLIGADGAIIENFATRPSQGASVKIDKALSAIRMD